MPYSPELVQANTASRERLRALFARLNDAQYTISLDEDWTVGTALAHVAFFDRRAIDILGRGERESISDSPTDIDILNRALLPFLRALSPAAISKLTLETAETLDAKLAALSDNLLDQIAALPESPFSLDRSEHRNEHIDQIETVLS